MNQIGRICLNVVCLLALILLPACIPDGFSSSTSSAVTVSIADIQANYSSYESQLVSVRGYGVIMMTVPLCPGYVGMDTRLSFVGEEDNQITTVVTASDPGAERSDSLREFQGYVSVFNGEIGCPGSLRTETFPYLEIVAIK
jgi:hypothetical protein